LYLLPDQYPLWGQNFTLVRLYMYASLIILRLFLKLEVGKPWNERGWLQVNFRNCRLHQPTKHAPQDLSESSLHSWPPAQATRWSLPAFKIRFGNQTRRVCELAYMGSVCPDSGTRCKLWYDTTWPHILHAFQSSTVCLYQLPLWMVFKGLCL